jgi:hypothetical protein
VRLCAASCSDLRNAISQTNAAYFATNQALQEVTVSAIDCGGNPAPASAADASAPEASTSDASLTGDGSSGDATSGDDGGSQGDAAGFTDTGAGGG